MAIENWLYRVLGRPQLRIVGEVASDPTEARDIDWIHLADFGPDASREGGIRFPEVRCRGGCELEGVGRYFRLHADALLQETHRQRGPFFVHLDSTTMALLASSGDGQVAELERLSFADGDIRSGFLAPVEPGSILVYSGWGDLTLPYYRRRTTGDMVPVNIIGFGLDVHLASDAELNLALASQELGNDERARANTAIQYLRSEFEPWRTLTSREMREAAKSLLERVPSGATLFVVLAATKELDENGMMEPRPRAVAYNRMWKSLAASRSFARLIEMDRCICSKDETDGGDHFSRIVYFHIFEAILEACAADRAVGRQCLFPTA